MAIIIESRRRGAQAATWRRQTRPMSDINVTPLVDVMLVLLVIFMITAPLMATGVQVDLPKAETAEVKTPDQPLAISVDKSGKIFIGDHEVTMAAMIDQLTTTAANNPDVRVFVRGDQSLAYGQVMAIIAAVHNAGLHKVALLTQPPADVPPSGRQRAALR
jgi:biopolymer transport protein TolR